MAAQSVPPPFRRVYASLQTNKELQMNKLEIVIWGATIRAAGSLAVLGTVFLGTLILLL